MPDKNNIFPDFFKDINLDEEQEEQNSLFPDWFADIDLGEEEDELEDTTEESSEFNHITTKQLKDHRWGFAESDIVKTLTEIYGEDFEFTEEAVGSDQIGIKKTLQKYYLKNMFLLFF